MDKELTIHQINHLYKVKKNLNSRSADVLKKLDQLEEILSKGITPDDLVTVSDFSSIELLHGIDSYDLICEMLRLHQDYREDNWSFLQLLDGWHEDLLKTGFDLQSNAEKSRLYSWVRESMIWTKQEEIFFVWLATLWQQKELYKYPINAYTIQNNSVEMFDLNRIAWLEHLPEAESFNEAPVYSHPYTRPLSQFEIAQRIRLKHAPPFKSYARLFKKSNSPILVLCSYYTAYKVFTLNEDGEMLNLIDQGQYENWPETLQAIHQFSTQQLLEGYEEIEADREIAFDKNALDFDILEFKSCTLITDPEVDAIIGYCNHLVSPSYRSFLKRFYKVALVKKKYAFPISDNAYKKLNNFLYPDQVGPIAKLNGVEYLKIAQTSDSLMVVSDHLGKIYLAQRDNEVLFLFEDFSDFIHSIFEYDFIEEEEVDRAENGDVDFFRNYLKNNYVDNKFGFEKTLLNLALEHPQLVEFLLEQGANPNKLRMPFAEGIEESMHLLKRYGYDPSVWVNSRGERFESLFNRWPYRDVFSDVQPVNYRHAINIPLRKRHFLDHLKLKKIERFYGNKIPSEVKTFILNHAGVELKGLWLKIDINSGCYLKMERILSLDEIPSFISLHKSRNKANGFGKANSCLPIAKTVSYETIYLEEKNGNPYLGIDNQYEIINFLSTRVVSKKGDLIEGLFDSFYHEEQLFVFEAKAILNNDVTYISTLLQKNWNPNHPLHPYGTPLGLAMYLNNFEMVDLLLDGGAEIASVINDTDYLYGAKKPLDAAMTMCSLEMVKHLISKGVLNFDLTGDYYENAINLIARGGRTHLKEVLPDLKMAAGW